MSSQPSNEIFLVNPYQSHASLTPVEAEILWEYAKLAQNLRTVCLTFWQGLEKYHITSKVTQKTRLLHEEPDKHMLAKLRILEKKMGLVLTLVSTTRFYLTVILFFAFISSVQGFCVGRDQRTTRILSRIQRRQWHDHQALTDIKTIVVFINCIK